MLRWLTFFRRLRWKLAVSYALVTLLALLAFSLYSQLQFSLATGSEIDLTRFPETMLTNVQRLAQQVASALAAEPIDQDGLGLWIQSTTDNLDDASIFVVQPASAADSAAEPVKFYVYVDFLAVTDADGTLLVREPRAGVPTPEDLTVIAEGLKGEAYALERSDHQLLVVAPAIGPSGAVVGTLFLRMQSPAKTPLERLNTITLNILEDLMRIAPTLLLLGAIFGIISMRNVTKRLNRLVEAASSWRRGQFHTTVRDQSGDELGDLTRQLNRMAADLETLLSTRQQLAGLEERNRLARDLHDAVKQQVFAAGMQIGSAQLALEQGEWAVAKTHISESKQLLGTIRRELNGLIQELRPAGLEGKGLAQALRDYVADWERQQGIGAEVAVSGERPFPLLIEQTLFRVAQEALSNVARHSQATMLKLLLQYSDSALTLRIEDDGIGFDAQASGVNGVGLHSMQERLAPLGGQLAIYSQAGGGTHLIASVPLGEKQVM